jgi:hypothetical protein
MRPLPFSHSMRPIQMRSIDGATSCDEDGIGNAVREAVLFEDNPPRFWHFVCPQCEKAERWKRWIGVLVCTKCQVRMPLRCIPVPEKHSVTSTPEENDGRATHHAHLQTNLIRRKRHPPSSQHLLFDPLQQIPGRLQQILPITATCPPGFLSGMELTQTQHGSHQSIHGVLVGALSNPSSSADINRSCSG